MAGRIEALTKELKVFQDNILRLVPLAQQEMLNYRMLETQHSQLQEKNTELARQSVEAEERIRKAVESADLIVAQAEREKGEISASILALYAKANSRYKELESKLNEAEKSAMIKTLKNLEDAAI